MARNENAVVGTSCDLESINNIVAAIKIDRFIAVFGVLPVDDRRAFDLGFQHYRIAGRSMGVEAKAPSAAVIGIHSWHDDDCNPRRGKAVSMRNRSERFTHRSGIPITALGRNIKLLRLDAKNA